MNPTQNRFKEMAKFFTGPSKALEKEKETVISSKVYDPRVEKPEINNIGDICLFANLVHRAKQQQKLNG